MKAFIIILFFSCLALLGLGYWQLNSEHVALGHKLIGSSCLLGMFVLMPCFIYHRWKNKNVKDYMLTDESFKRMREYKGAKEAEKRKKD